MGAIHLDRAPSGDGAGVPGHGLLQAHWSRSVFVPGLFSSDTSSLLSRGTYLYT